MSKLKELKNSILADGIIDEQEVKQLREIFYEDGKIDYEDATRAALLHDFFQDEDLKDMKTLNKYQVHPYLAYLKSSKMFNVNEVQKDAIICHMWPWTLKIPRYKESWIVTVSDKVISLREWFSFRLAVTVSIWILFFFNIITIQK